MKSIPSYQYYAGGRWRAAEGSAQYADSGSKLWSSDLGGAIAGGVISYDTGAGQKVAVAAGMTSPIWPTAKVTAKVAILGRQ